MVRYLEFIKAICKQSEMWELNNPRVVGMMHNIIQCVQNEEECFVVLTTKRRRSFLRQRPQNVKRSELFITRL